MWPGNIVKRFNATHYKGKWKFLKGVPPFKHLALVVMGLLSWRETSAQTIERREISLDISIYLGGLDQGFSKLVWPL
jgi:hypothetical protein